MFGTDHTAVTVIHIGSVGFSAIVLSGKIHASVIIHLAAQLTIQIDIYLACRMIIHTGNMMPAAILRDLDVGRDIQNAHRRQIDCEVGINCEGDTRAFTSRATPELEEDLLDAALGQTLEPGFHGEARIGLITEVNGIGLEVTILIGIVVGYSTIIHIDGEIVRNAGVDIPRRSALGEINLADVAHLFGTAFQRQSRGGCAQERNGRFVEIVGNHRIGRDRLGIGCIRIQLSIRQNRFVQTDAVHHALEERAAVVGSADRKNVCLIRTEFACRLNFIRQVSILIETNHTHSRSIFADGIP